MAARLDNMFSPIVEDAANADEDDVDDGDDDKRSSALPIQNDIT